MINVIYALTNEYDFDFEPSTTSKTTAAGCAENCIETEQLAESTYFESAEICSSQCAKQVFPPYGSDKYSLADTFGDLCGEKCIE